MSTYRIYFILPSIVGTFPSTINKYLELLQLKFSLSPYWLYARMYFLVVRLISLSRLFFKETDFINDEFGEVKVFLRFHLKTSLRRLFYSKKK